MATTSTSTSTTSNGAQPGRALKEWIAVQVTGEAADRLRRHMFAMHHVKPALNQRPPHFNKACAEAFAAGVDRFIAEHPIPPAPYGA